MYVLCWRSLGCNVDVVVREFFMVIVSCESLSIKIEISGVDVGMIVLEVGLVIYSCIVVGL